MLVKSLIKIAILALATVSIHAQHDTRFGVLLSLGEGKTVYRSGEPITLVLSFSSQAAGYSVSTGQAVIDTVQDDVIISPDNGVFEWKKQFMRGAKYTSDAVSLVPLNNGPVKLELPINHFVRFDLPGRYTVKVKTKRIWHGHSGPIQEMTTNDVSFDVKMMTESEEAAEVARLSAAFDKANGWQEQTRIMTQLSYLTGKAAIPEKVKRFLTPVESGNYYQAAFYGLFMSKDRALVIRMLEEVFRDLNQPVNFGLLGVLSVLKRLHEVPALAKPIARTPFFYEEDPDELRIRAGYLKEIVDSLPKRQGKNLNEAAYLILQNLPRKDPPAEVLAKVRGILIEHFDELTFFGQEMLLSTYWETIRDPRLIRSLEKMLASGTLPDYARDIMRSHALRRLSEIDPIRARPLVIAEIRDSESMLNDDTVASLEDRPLPEIDNALVQQIRRFASAERGNADIVRLRLRCMLAARFATKAIFEQLLDIYKTNADRMQSDSRAFLISYFSRHDPKIAMELLEAEVGKIDKNNVSMFLGDLTRFYYSPELTPFLEKRLDSDDAEIAISGAYILSKNGPASSRIKIEARLKRWLARWRNHESELEGTQMKLEDQGQAMLQLELILALRDAKNWKITDAELKSMIADCKTQVCDLHLRPRKIAPVQ